MNPLFMLKIVPVNSTVANSGLTDKPEEDIVNSQLDDAQLDIITKGLSDMRSSVTKANE